MQTSILKNLPLFILIFISSLKGQVQDGIIDDPGDIAFVAYHNNPDGFSFVLLDDCPVDSSIRFIDEEWTGSEFASATNEGEVLWVNNTGSTIIAGTVINIVNADNATTSSGIMASIGIATEDDNGFNIANGDQIYAVTGTRETPDTFLTFIGRDNSINSSEVATLTGTGLVAGQTAVLTQSEGYYSGSTTCNSTATECGMIINSINNWTLGDFDFPMNIPSEFTGSGITGSAMFMVVPPSAPIVFEDEENVALDDNIQVIDPEGNDQTLTFVVTGGILTLGTTDITFGGSGNSSSNFTTQGTLNAINNAMDAATFTPFENLNGASTGSILFTADNGTTTSNQASVTFDIISANDKPTFVKGSDLFVSSEGGMQTINGWVDSIDLGAPDESDQSFMFTLNNDNSSLFSVQPEIDASGTLIFTPNAEAMGVATISVLLVDDGGVDNGGEDTSDTQTFVISLVSKPIITSISEDTGFSSSDYITSDNRPSINGMAFPGSIVSIVLDGTDSFDTGITAIADDTTGNFTIDYPATSNGDLVPDLEEGTINFQVVARIDNLTLISDPIVGAIDTIAPAVAISSTEGASTLRNPILITIAFTENVMDFIIDDIIVGNGFATNFTGSGMVYTADIIPTSFGEVTVDITGDIASDVAGNLNITADQFSIIYEATLGTSDATLEGEIQIYPNPVKDYIMIRSITHKNFKSLEVYDMLGKLVIQREMNAQYSNKIYLPSLDSGAYWLKVLTTEGFAYKKMIKD